MKNSYWNRTGKFQKEYEEMQAANFKYTKAEENAMYKYRRYYNDGDLPRGSLFIDKCRIELYLEIQANIAVAKAYLRFNPQCNNMTIKLYARNNCKGLQAYWN